MSRALPSPFTLHEYLRVDSTNDEARRLVAARAGHGTVISAVEQTAGRGRRGRAWGSPPGNLHCSILLDVDQDKARAPQLTFVAAVALREALAELLPAAGLQLKWPNDVLCSGQKIAGMLLEWADPLAILGIGVNVALVPDMALLFPATCLKRQGSAADPIEVLTILCEHLTTWYARWRQEGFAATRTAWLERAVGVGGPIKARLADETVLEGLFRGLDEDGALVLESDDGQIRRILAGDVFF